MTLKHHSSSGMKKILFTLACLIISPVLVASAQINETESAFKKVIEIPQVGVIVPTVVSLPLTGTFSLGEDFYVKEVETNTYVGSYFKSTSDDLDLREEIKSTPFTPATNQLIDSEFSSFAEFPVSGEGNNSVTLELKMKEPITTSRLNLRLSQYVALPTTIELKAGMSNDPNKKIAVAKRSMNSETIIFPETTADTFEITFEYIQPLRISDLDFAVTFPTRDSTQALRFLAQPNYSYQVYFDRDRPVNVRFVESGNLRLDEGVVVLPAYSEQNNIAYTPSDIDDDGIRDAVDNCVGVSNFDQIDIDGNGRGDVCDDYDKDGIINSEDNCINQPNRAQADEDYDGVGDICDSEESRFTERNQWIPWVGMGTAIVVILILFVLVARGQKPDQEPVVVDEEEKV